MNKIITYFILCFSLIGTLSAQEKITIDIADTLVVKSIAIDSIKITAIQEDSISIYSPEKKPISKTDAFIGSIFGPSKQLSNADSIFNQFDSQPSFSIYKDNYFVVGTELFKKPTKYNSDAKFQISIRQRLTNSTLPFKTYFFLTYTQRAFWDIFQESFPFRDLNFNPTLGLGRALVRDNRLIGLISMQFEHESNGKSEEESRSWNKVSFSTSLIMNDNWNMEAKVWIPIVDGENNRNIVKYAGWGYFAANYSSPKQKYNMSCMVVKRGGFNLNANVVLDFSIRLFSDDNQYLFVQYYNGYGESLLDYNQYRQRIRVGILIKPQFRLFF